jgi:hypothetical protein
MKLEGFAVYVNPECLQHPEPYREALQTLEGSLRHIGSLIQPDRLTVLRETPFWLEWKAQPGGAAEFHNSAEWLQSNGYNPQKAGGVEISNLVNFVQWTRSSQPMMVLHELAHAFHFRRLGFGSDKVRSVYLNALKNRLYDDVEKNNGRRYRAYALMNPMEYFAECSEAYHGRNDFFPYVHTELRAHDPLGYSLMEEVWGPRRSFGDPDAPPPPPKP